MQISFSESNSYYLKALEKCQCPVSPGSLSLTCEYADTFENIAGNTVFAPGEFFSCWFCLHPFYEIQWPSVQSRSWTIIIVLFVTCSSRFLWRTQLYPVYTLYKPQLAKMSNGCRCRTSTGSHTSDIFANIVQYCFQCNRCTKNT